MEDLTPEEVSDLMINRGRELKDYLRYTSSLGTMDTALSQMLSGLNIIPKVKPYAARNRFKKVFFTRPMINLSYENLMQSRKLAKLMNNNPSSIERYILCLLDPRQEYGSNSFPTHRNAITNNKYGIIKKSTLIDKYQPFMPVLTNTLMQISGYPDVTLDTYTNTPGMRKEVVGWTNSINRIYTAFDLDTTFLNTMQEPVFKIMDIWTEYQALVSEGVVLPWFDFIIGRRIDYTVGMTTFVLDEDNRTINHTSKTIGHPIVSPNGKFYDIDEGATVSEETHDINMRFRCYGVEYDDPMTLLDFNRYVSSFNPKLRGYILDNASKKENNDYVELPPHLYSVFSNFAVPYVDLIYKKLEWLISKSDLNIIKKNISNKG